MEERVIANRFMGSQFQATTIKVHSTDNTVMAIEVGLNDEKCSIFTKRIVCMYLCMYCTGAIIVCMCACMYVSGAVPPLGMLGMHPPPPAMFTDLVKPTFMAHHGPQQNMWFRHCNTPTWR